MQTQPFTLEALKSYPFPSALTAAAQGSRLAWAFDEQGRRNVYVAEGPAFAPRKLTNYTLDDGQELTGLAISADGQWVVYVRGGEHGALWDEDKPVNPTATPVPLPVTIWAVPFAGGTPHMIAAGSEPAISPAGNRVAFIRNGQVWLAPLGEPAAAENLFTTRGSVNSLQWSPDGACLAFVSHRGGHSFVGVYTNAATPLTWLAPSFYKDLSPRWSPDGGKIVFVRTAGAGGAPDPYLAQRYEPWTIMIAEVATGGARQLWKAPATLPGSIPNTHGDFNLHWAAKDRIVFVSYQNGWPHLYAVPASGGEPLLLTPGNFMAEHICLSPDRQWLVFSANTGPDKADIDRRHLLRVPVDAAKMELLTSGTGIEAFPVITGDGATLALLSASALQPLLPAVMPFRQNSTPRILARDRVPAAFSEQQLVTPTQVTYQAPDGLTIHAQLFESKGESARKPALVYVHGGPSRQMLLGWSYSEYYANAYALNQYLASQGFVVLSVNYRLGTGYGYEFHKPQGAGLAGASEYQDIKAAGEWLARQPQVDATRIGIFGGSYGGYLTALALARDSALFAAGADIHGMSDRTAGRMHPLLFPDRYERAPDAEAAAEVIWQASPVAAIANWTSPVLLIHGDDDRNVAFSQSIDLVNRLEAKGVPFETLVLVDETHHWMQYGNALKVNEAVADFFKRKLLDKPEV